MAANWWEPPPVTSAQQKNYVRPPAANGSLSVPMAPLPSVGTSQPVTPLPGMAAAPGGRALQMPVRSPFSAMSAGNYGGGAMGGMGGRGLSPEGQQLLSNSPELAQWLSERSAVTHQLTAEAQGLSQRAAQMLEPVEYGQETPGYSQQYWNARTQRAKADSAAKFQVKRQIAEDNLASGRWSAARYRRELANIQDESLQDIGNAMGGLETERAQIGEQQRLARADRYLAQMQAQPVDTTTTGTRGTYAPATRTGGWGDTGAKLEIPGGFAHGEGVALPIAAQQALAGKAAKKLWEA